MSCGSRHTVAWSRQGRAIGFGSNFNAQLSFDFSLEEYRSNLVWALHVKSIDQAVQTLTLTLQLAPRVLATIPLRRRVEAAACGSRHTLFLLEGGTVAAVGCVHGSTVD